MDRKEAIKVLKLNEVENLLLNMSSGLKPKDLTKTEVKLLERKYGKNWFEHLGYDYKIDKLPFQK